MTSTRRHKALLAAAAALLLVTLGCGLVSDPTPTITSAEMGEAGSPQPPGALPTDTPMPDVSGPGECTLNAAWVADVTVPDGTQFPPGASFTKTWRVRNSGSCLWEPGTLLVFVSGDPLGGPGSVSAGLVAPGSTTDVSVNFVAPTAPGTYKGNWQLQAPDGTRYGSILYVQIVVPAPPTDSPVPPPTAVPPSETPTVGSSPVLTLGPVLTGVIPLFLPKFDAVFVGSHKCGFFGPYWATFRVENTGSPTLESMHLTIDSAGSDCVYQHNAPFMVSSSDCPPGQAALASGDVAFVACNVGMGPLLFINAEATIRLCTQDGGGASCAERTVTVPP